VTVTDSLLDLYFQYYNKSIKFKDLGYVGQELQNRQLGTAQIIADYANRPATADETTGAVYALGKANEAVTLGYHIGDGLGAYDAALEALKDLPVLSLAESIWRQKMPTTPIKDVLLNIRQWTNGYEECIKYLNLFFERYPDPTSGAAIEEFRDNQRKGVPWYKVQLNFAYNFYSRETAELDRGFYPPAMSILQCVLKRMQDQQPGYELLQQDEYSTYLHLLDDYVVISHKYVVTLLQRHKEAIGAVNLDIYDDFYLVLAGPLRFWLDFMPDIQNKDLPTFLPYFQLYYMMFAPFGQLPVELTSLEPFFPEALKVCPKCHKKYPVVLDSCAFCAPIFRVSLLSRIFKKFFG
jgi:hypothetical protein